MSSGMVKRMYDFEDKFLYEILDDYKDSESNKGKEEILSDFMNLIWSSDNKRIITQKKITFTVIKSLLETDIGQIFNQYSSIPYTSYKSISKETDFISLLRQKINNIYTNLCDGRVCLKKEYMDLIKSPKQMYYRWKNGEIFDVNTLSDKLNEIVKQSESVKEEYAKQKMNISWNDYKKLIKGYFARMFENYIPLEEYEDKTQLTINTEAWCEDNFAIAYLCKGLDGYMRNYQKEYYNLQRNKIYGRCDCGGMFIQSKQNNRFKCDLCGTYQPISTKTIQCIDCGKDVEVDSKDNKTERCEECYKIYRRNKIKENVRNYRKRINNKNM